MHSHLSIRYLFLSRQQEGAASVTVNVQLLVAIKSLQEQVADLQAKSTQAVAVIQQLMYVQETERSR